MRDLDAIIKEIKDLEDEYEDKLEAFLKELDNTQNWSWYNFHNWL